MQLKAHKLVGAEYQAARLIGPVITPEIVILHDTAGRLTKYNSRDYLAASTMASVHFVVERDGTISQLVPTNRRAAHAGQSAYNGRRDCNGFSIGIEIVNPGRMAPVGNGIARAWFGQTFDPDHFALVEMTTPEHGFGVWMGYTEEQIEAVEALLKALFKGIPTLRDITTHWYVSPGRKVDTNPLFPLEELRARVLGRDDPADAEAEASSSPAHPQTMVRIATGSGAALNLRRWPSFNPNIIGQIPTDTLVPVLRSGSFEGQPWLNVRFDGREGWIVARYTATV
jgi:N-acetylmuramoyl-L-alanine amidase